jgi:hypothetical protein
VSNVLCDDFVGLKIKPFSGIWVFFSLNIFILILYQILGESPDWQNYNEFFDLLRDHGWGVLATNRFELGFGALSFFLINMFASNLVAYGFIAVTSILIKCWAINQFTSSRLAFLGVMIFYALRFAPLHELTQLRVAFSISLMLLATMLIWRRDSVSAVLACTLAITFHLSAIVLIPFVLLGYFINGCIKLLSRKFIILTGGFVFLVTFYGIELALEYFENSFSVIAMYQDAGFGNETPNLLSPALLMDWSMIFVAIFMWNKLPLMMRYVVFVEIVGMAIFYASIDFQVIAFRLREFFSVFWVFFIAQGLKQKYFMRNIVVYFLAINIVLYSYYFFFNSFFF